ncbi:hypothetical protein ASD8599_01759 [Ascidiaceihabitans donghaensis]|uniref:Uncharacterized protein n=1 Tax=Ascidiaceihabitans donghaensis TaxID=1510460 RepID=A0A2R8BD57_9RHOB|nr:hypothetical protein [Ascidiaceihabitans donghaensis]SPH21018.1 hypothetical protein ASD8599_01759 [Ascidiaceihabitans donghaensis]
MSTQIKNPVTIELERLSKEFGISASTISGRAFKNSRKADQLLRRDEGDADALKKLAKLSVQLEAERQERVSKLFPSRRIERASAPVIGDRN